MIDKNFESIHEQAKKWVYEAGGAIRDSLDKPMLIETKSNANDLVTEIDKSTEEFFVNKIRDSYPSHKIIGEEGFGDQEATLSGTVWFIDPIDGTINFVHQKRNFAISVGVYHDGVGMIGLIYDVMSDVLYEARKGAGAFKNGSPLGRFSGKRKLKESILGINGFWATENRRVEHESIQKLIKDVRGTRSYGSAALEFAYLAEGIMDGYVTMKLAPWDIAAGIVIVEEVGGITSRADGSAISLEGNNSIVSSHPSIHKEITEQYIQLKDNPSV
ncbi:inositol monophosphatase family protein [Bacillaceae bacterium S4-13-58]